MAGCGRRMILGGRGRQFLMRRGRRQLERLRWLPRIQTSFTYRVARDWRAPTLRWVTEFTNRQMPEKRGPISRDFATGKGYLRWLLIRATRTGCLPRCAVILTVRMKSAAFF